jgi:hypothetical protein
MDRLIDLTGPQTAAEALDGWVLTCSAADDG